MILHRFRFWVGIVLGPIGCWAATAPPPATLPTRGEILAIDGKVEWAGQSGAWQPAAVGRKLSVGDGIRTGEFSRATVRLPAGSVLRIDEFTTLRVPGESDGTQ